MDRDNLVFDNYRVPIVVSKKDFDSIQNIAVRLYFDHKILQHRSDMDQILASVEENFAQKQTSMPRFSRLEAIRYLFYRFCLQSDCRLVLWSEENKDYVPPAVSNMEDPNFDLSIDYCLRIKSVKSEKVYILFISVSLDSRTRVLILAELESGKTGSVTAPIISDPRMLAPAELRSWMRDFWSCMDAKFYRKAFMRLKNDQTILHSNSSSCSMSA